VLGPGDGEATPFEPAHQHLAVCRVVVNDKDASKGVGHETLTVNW